MRPILLNNCAESDLLCFKLSNLYTQIKDNWEYVEVVIEYYKEYFGSGYRDTSIVVFDNNNQPVIALISYSKMYNFTFFDKPIEIFVNQDFSHDIISSAYSVLFKFISNFFIENGVKRISFYENSFFLGNFYHCSHKVNANYLVSIDLTKQISEIKKGIRSRYRSLINWGEKNMGVRVVTSKNASFSEFNLFKEFHHKISGRVTRSSLSWELQFKAIEQNNAFLVMGYFNEELVSGIFVLCGNRKAYYGVGVNDRNLMFEKKPISHFIMMKAIILAKEYGCDEFIVGDLGDNEKDEKLNNIFNFKRGFSNEIRLKNIITVEIN